MTQTGDIITDRSKFADGWRGGLPETPCGGGSTVENTRRQRAWIPRIVEKYRIHYIANVGAGDLNWWGQMPLPAGTTTYHLDLVPRHENAQWFDVVADVPPKVDLIMCLWVLNHLPSDDREKAMENIRASGSRYLLATPAPPMPALEELVLFNGNRMILAELQ